MTDAHWQTSDVGTQFIADAEAILDDANGPALAVTIDGNATRGLVFDTFSEEDDPRVPVVLVKIADVDGINHGAAVVLNSVVYHFVTYRPVGPGIAQLQLRLT